MNISARQRGLFIPFRPKRLKAAEFRGRTLILIAASTLFSHDFPQMIFLDLMFDLCSVAYRFNAGVVSMIAPDRSLWWLTPHRKSHGRAGISNSIITERGSRPQF